MPEESTEPALRPWFQVHPERFQEEREGLEAMGFVLDEECLQREETVVFGGQLAAFPERKLTITFPDRFPWLAPSVADDGNCLLLPRHQRNCTRGYCLFGPESEAWHAGLSGTDAISETERLISDVLSQPSDAPRVDDPFPEPVSAQQLYTSGLGTVLVPPGVSDLAPTDLSVPAEGLVQIRYQHKELNGAARGVVIGAEFKGGAAAMALKGYTDFLSQASDRKGKLIYLPKLAKAIGTSAELQAVIKEAGFSVGTNYDWCAIIYPEENGSADGRRLSWLVFKNDKGSYKPVRTSTFRSSEREVRVPGLAFLKDKVVMIIGAGSIGSKIAAALAATGVNRFFLIDRDVMNPENSVRHECGVDQFGTAKADAVARKLKSINPDCSDFCFGLGYDPLAGLEKSRRQNFATFLKVTDILIDATGHQGASRAISEISREFKIPSVYVSVTNGAWSGEIYRQIPGRGNCWSCFQAAFPDPPAGAPVPPGRIFAPGCDQPTFIGTTYDLDVLAGMATGFIVDTLRMKDGSPSEYTGDYVLWEGRGSDGKLIQKATFHQVPARLDCGVCRVWS